MNKTTGKNIDFRVAMISEHGDPLAPLGGQQSGGQNVYVYELARSLSKLGIKVDVFTRWENRKSAQIVRFAKRAKVIRLKAGPRHFLSKDKFGPLMPEFVEHFLEYTRKNKIKYSVIHTHYYFSGWAGLQLRRILGVPVVATFHSLGLLKKKALGERDTSPTERTKIEKQIMEEANLIVATSPQEQGDMVAVYKEKDIKTVIIPPGVNLRRFIPVNKLTARKRMQIPQGKKIVVFAGKMERRKGGLTLVEAVKEIRDESPDLYKNLIVYMFSGDPRIGRKKEKQESTARHDLKDAINRLGKDSPIRLLPGIGQEKLHYFYAAADVVVMPSYYEPFGMVAIEAMASGTPVVASSVGGLKWTVQDGITGLHAKPKDAKSFAKQITRILTDEKLAKKMSDLCPEYVKERFSWPGIGKSLLKEYKRVASQSVNKITKK